MATTEYTVNSPETVKRWSKKLHKETLKKTWVQKFVGKSDSSMIQEITDLNKNAGDRVRMQLNVLLTGEGVQGDAIAEGKEENLTMYTDDILIDQIRHPVNAGGRMTQQRTLHDLRAVCMDNLSKWMAQRYDRAFFLQGAGLTTATAISEHGETYNPGKTIYTGNNATLAPSAGRKIFGYASSGEDATTNTTDQALAAGDEMRLQYIDDLVTTAKTASPMIKPVSVGGEDMYVLFLHPYQVRDLRQDASTAGNWFDIQKAALQGGKVGENPIFTGSLGVYNNVILHESSRIPQGQNASSGAFITTVRRALFCGAQAFGLAFGKGDSFGSMNWAEELKDYGNMLNILAGSIYGLKAARFNSVDYGKIVLSTYAATA